MSKNEDKEEALNELIQAMDGFADESKARLSSELWYTTPITMLPKGNVCIAFSEHFNSIRDELLSLSDSSIRGEIIHERLNSIEGKECYFLLSMAELHIKLYETLLGAKYESPLWKFVE